MHAKRKEQTVIKCEWLAKMKSAAESADMGEMAKLRDQMKETLILENVAPVIARERADGTLRQAMNFLKV
jgi:hypothetical protein